MFTIEFPKVRIYSILPKNVATNRHLSIFIEKRKCLSVSTMLRMGPYRRTDASPRSYGRVRTALRTGPYDGSYLSVGCCKQNSQSLSRHRGCPADGHVPPDGTWDIRMASDEKNSPGPSVRPPESSTFTPATDASSVCSRNL